MTNFVSLNRWSQWPRALGFAQNFIEDRFSITHLNAIVRGLEGCTAQEFFFRISDYCGEYALPDISGLIGEGSPKVFIANHPLGGADIVAALRLLESLS